MNHKYVTLGIAAIIAAMAITAVGFAVPQQALAHDHLDHDSADSSTTNVDVNLMQKGVVSGFKNNVQNCAQINIDSIPTAGDEGVDCHNQREESSNHTSGD